MKIRNFTILLVSIIAGFILFFVGVNYFRTTDERIVKFINDTRVPNFDIIKDVNLSFNSCDDSYFQTKFSVPTGILVEDGNIYITDSKKNCIYFFNSEGVLLEIIGSTGNGDNQLLAPCQIKFYDNHFFVLDSGNNRIQVFDKDFLYVKSIRLKVLDDFAEIPYCDFDIDKDGNIFVSNLAIKTENTHVYKISADGVINQLGDELVGFVTSVDGSIYFVNNKLVITGRQEGQVVTISANYENFIYRIENDKLEVVSELPFSYSPANFTYDESSLYFYSEVFNTLDRFDKDGKYISTLYEFEPESKIKYITYDAELDCFFASSPQNGKVYRITNNG